MLFSIASLQRFNLHPLFSHGNMISSYKNMLPVSCTSQLSCQYALQTQRHLSLYPLFSTHFVLNWSTDNCTTNTQIYSPNLCARFQVHLVKSSGFSHWSRAFPVALQSKIREKASLSHTLGLKTRVFEKFGFQKDQSLQTKGFLRVYYRISIVVSLHACRSYENSSDIKSSGFIASVGNQLVIKCQTGILGYNLFCIFSACHEVPVTKQINFLIEVPENYPWGLKQ